MDYKNTIITPKTDFPMKAGLPAREPGMLKAWQDMDLYNAMLEKNKELPPFVLHDGPPFSNGYIHMGHALNKTLKEAGIREKYHCLIAGVERGGETLHAPDPHEPFVEGDVVWVVGESADVYELVSQKGEGFDMEV